eukprot:jgi/Tetstr1/448462/TSEL_035730.t1
MGRSHASWYGLCSRGFAALAEGRLPAAGGHFARHQAAHTAAAVMPPAGRAAACATHDTAAALPPLLHSMGLLGLRLGGATGLGGAASRGGAAARQAAAGQRGMAQLPFKPPPGEVPKRPARKPAPAPAEGGSEASVKAPELTPEQMTSMLYMPWERRQIQGGALKWWEKTYWVLLAIGIGVLAVSRMYNPWAPPIPVLDSDLEARKREAARAVLAGRKHFLDDDDPFEGMEPQDLQSYIIKQTGAIDIDDPFEGMTPDEINEYVKSNPEAQP